MHGAPQQLKPLTEEPDIMARIGHVNQQVQIEVPGLGKVKVDEAMAPLILLLNAKGFPTKWSSQGIQNGTLRDDETDEEICKVSCSPGYITFKDSATLQRFIARRQLFLEVTDHNFSTIPESAASAPHPARSQPIPSSLPASLR